jgi:putative ATP-dependent endonuclease of the OLD family
MMFQRGEASYEAEDSRPPSPFGSGNTPMKYIEKIKLKNFKRFEGFEQKLDPSLNILIGENEAGKSSILTAISLTLNGNRSQIETLGMERLLNTTAVGNFLKGDRRFDHLPELFVELYLNDHHEKDLEGKTNSEHRNCHGLRLECRPNDELQAEIEEVLHDPNSGFPFDYYVPHFLTFAGDGYTGHKKYLSYLLIDTSTISTEYATRHYVNRMYETYVPRPEQHKHQHEYRKLKASYRDSILRPINKDISDYQFALKNDSKSNLSTDLTLMHENVDIENQGKGRQCFIKTSFALRKTTDPKKKLDVALIEEPENHLSHINMKNLIDQIRSVDDKQVVIATHSNMISARLGLRHAILMHKDSDNALAFTDLGIDTANFFMKAPNSEILNFVLSKKVLLVEGSAEYILMEKMFQTVTKMSLEAAHVHVLAVGGISFKRYLDIARLLKMRVAVIRDSDGNYQQYCVDTYADYVSDSIAVFGDQDTERRTFEICVCRDNREKCTRLFDENLRTRTVEQFMLDNKTDAAYAILNDYDGFVVPLYIREGIEWLLR